MPPVDYYIFIEKPWQALNIDNDRAILRANVEMNYDIFMRHIFLSTWDA